MNLIHGSAAAESESPEETMTADPDLIRAALYARNARLNLSGLAGAVGVPVDTLEGFLAGRVTLLPAVLSDLTRELWAGDAVYDETVDRLRPALRQEP